MSGDRPLQGKRVLVTRTREQAEGLVDRLHALGADVVVVPLIATVPAVGPEEVTATRDRLAAAPPPRWVVFTSATAVRLVSGALGGEGLARFEVATVGEATAAAVRAAGSPVSLIAGQRDAQGLAEALVGRGVLGATVWLPVAEGADDLLPVRLANAGANIVVVQRVYRTRMPPDAGDRLRSALQKPIDAVTLTSGSTARNLVDALAGRELPAETAVVCIGAQTARIAECSGLRVDAVAIEQSVDGLVEALSAWLARLG